MTLVIQESDDGKIWRDSDLSLSNRENNFKTERFGIIAFREKSTCNFTKHHRLIEVKVIKQYNPPK